MKEKNKKKTSHPPPYPSFQTVSKKKEIRDEKKFSFSCVRTVSKNEKKIKKMS
jgi:hypothetical protein